MSANHMTRTVPWMATEYIEVDGVRLVYERHGPILHVCLPGGKKVSAEALMVCGHKVRMPVVFRARMVAA